MGNGGGGGWVWGGRSRKGEKTTPSCQRDRKGGPWRPCFVRVLGCRQKSLSLVLCIYLAAWVLAMPSIAWLKARPRANIFVAWCGGWGLSSEGGVRSTGPPSAKDRRQDTPTPSFMSAISSRVTPEIYLQVSNVRGGGWPLVRPSPPSAANFEQLKTDDLQQVRRLWERPQPLILI